ncbi:MAG: hypothetical protein NZ918_03310 [Aigarchaeota archaeon]|nr:hypothetical protein [Aigarchaeota archaeon]
MSLRLEEILNLGARIGIQAKFDHVERAQIENIISSLDFVEDKKLSLLVTALFAERQAERLRRGHNTARLINDAMTKLFTSGLEKEHARQLLGIAKWVYEAAERRRLNLRVEDIPKLTLKEVLEHLRGR